MPEQISLDDSSFDLIYEKAREHLQTQASWWTHREISDPGITLLEMWSLLTDMQSFYMDQIQESHYRKYLKLLGIRPDEGENAAVWIFFDGVTEDCTVPRGTKLLADRMVFETKEEAELTSNRIRGFYQESGKNRAGDMQMFRKNRFRLQEGEALFSFSLEKAVAADGKLPFFVLLDERIKRNPAPEDFYMVRLVWEFWTREGWREARVEKDETRGLLYSGCICLWMDQTMEHRERTGFEIRCRIIEGAYDVMPALYKVCLNVTKAVQKNTLCCQESAEFTKTCHRVQLNGYLAKTGEVRVFRELGGDRWEDITGKCVIGSPVSSECRKRYAEYPGEGKVKLLCSAWGFLEEYGPWTIAGTASQTIALPWENLKRSSVELMLRQGRDTGIYRIYRRVEPEEERYENAWHWQEEENVIVLGDGRHGDIPLACENGLRFASLVLWEGDRGNAAIGAIGQWERPDLFPGITCTNFMTAKGGRNRRNPSRQFAEAKAALLLQKRMATEEDIRQLAMETPGLPLRDAKAEWKEGLLTVTIFPWAALNSGYCSERYCTLVERHLESYRLAGSRIKVRIAEEG